MRAKILNKIEDIEMLGDRFHNEIIDTLFEGVDNRSKYAKIIKFRLDNYYLKSKDRWIHLPKSYAKKLNGIMKSKTEKTFQKRLVKYIKFLAFGTHYGSVFNKSMILELSKEVKDND